MKGVALSAFLVFLAVRFSFSVRLAGFLLAVFRGDLSDIGHLIQIFDLVRASEVRARQSGSGRLIRRLAACPA
jgi:hypothetical protein